MTTTPRAIILCTRSIQSIGLSGVFPFRRMPCKLFFPTFSFLISFSNATQPFYGCQRNARKNITVTVSVRVSVTVRVSLVCVSKLGFGKMGFGEMGHNHLADSAVELSLREPRAL